MKGCGAEHLLVELWDEVHSAMEKGQCAGILLGVDFEKAFNRMDHSVCLARLRELGASEGSVSLVGAFLEGRRMTIRIGEHEAHPVDITKGSPQGSVLGCLLYCVTTQKLTYNLKLPAAVSPEEVPIPNSRPQRSASSATLPAVPPRGRPVQYFPQDSSDEEGVEFWGPEAHTAEDQQVGTGDFIPKLLSFKYIDDTTIFMPALMSGASRHITTADTVERFEELPLGAVLEDLLHRSSEIGMKINTAKTQLLVISPPNGCITSAVITANGVHIELGTKMKLVGFNFGTGPGAGEYVLALRDKFRCKVWMLYHLREAGLNGAYLFRMYCCYMRSILEYCAPVYHSMLTAGQALALERMHLLAIRICYGFDQPVELTMQQHCIETLEERRVRRCDSFIRKAYGNPVFWAKWFPSRPDTGHDLRNMRKINESKSHSNRHFNSPLNFFRRQANELGLG